MKYLFLSLLISLTAAASECNVIVSNHRFNANGTVIHFDFTDLLQSKNYKEVLEAEKAQYLLTVHGEEKVGRNFHSAYARFSVTDLKGELVGFSEDIRLCLTQHCSPQDFAKAFNKTYQKLWKSLKPCN